MMTATGAVSAHFLPQLHSLVESIDEVLIVTDRELRILAFNDTARAAFLKVHGHTLRVGASYCSLLPEHDQGLMRRLFEAALREERVEMRRLHPQPDGRQLAYHLALRPLRHDGKVAGVIFHARDITAQHEAEQNLRRSMERHELVLRATSDVVWEWNLLTNENWFSANLERQFGQLPAGGGPNEWQKRIHPDDVERVLGVIVTAMEQRSDRWECEYRLCRADGTWAWVLDRAHTIYDEAGFPQRMIGSIQDISKLKELQERIVGEELRAQRLVTEAAIRSQEQERAALGRELHDNINQILASCKLMTEVALREEAMRDTLMPRTLTQLNLAIEEIRGLSRKLVKPNTDQLALPDALRDLLETAACTHDCQPVLRVEGNPLPLDPQQSLMLYRIAQEQLHNVQKHAEATEVEVLVAYEDELLLRIRDNGKGFDLKARGNGIGLRNMQSRAEMFQGRFSIQSRPGAGCCLEVRMPLHFAQQ